MMNHSLTETEIRENILTLAKALLSDQLIVRTWGNISARLDKNTMIITPSGKAYETMVPSDLVKMSIVEGKILDEHALKPSSEAPMHAIAYIRRPEVNVVVHTHQIYASALSLSTREFPLNGDDANQFKTRSLPISKYHMPTTKKLHQNMDETLKSNPSKAILMERHGAFILGNSFDECLENTRSLENFAKQTYQKLTMRSLNIRPSIDFDTADEVRLKDSLFSSAMISVCCDPEIKFLKAKVLRPYLDDFAQIVGTSVSDKKKTANAFFAKSRAHAYCFGNTKEDADNVRAVFEKNLRAAIIGEIFGRKPINSIESRIMREIYIRKYSVMK